MREIVRSYCAECLSDGPGEFRVPSLGLILSVLGVVGVYVAISLSIIQD